MPTVLPTYCVAGLEDAVGDLADVFGRDAGHLRGAHRERPRELAVVALLRGEAEHVEVVPVERRDEERRRQAAEQRVRFGLGVEVRHAILLLQHRHALVVGLHELADVLERRPDDVLDARGLRRVGDVLRLSLLLLAGEVLPEIRHGVDAVRAGERLLQALDVVEVALTTSRAGGSERFRLVLARVARNGSARRSRRRDPRESRGTSPPPCEPVEPNTAMIFLSAMSIPR